eukprot:Opistho-2@28418
MATKGTNTASLSRLEARSMTRLMAISIEDVIQEFMERHRLKKPDEILEMYMGEMSLESAPDLSHLSQLQVLWLNRNKLRTLDFLRQNIRLKQLYLQHNRIGSISDVFQGMRHLQVLLLQDNQLRGLKETVAALKILTELEVLNLFGNPAAQELNYRLYVVHNLPSLRILDRKEITEIERFKARALFEPIRETIRQSIAFGRRNVGSPDGLAAQPRAKSHRSRTKNFASLHDEERVDSGGTKGRAPGSRGGSASYAVKSKFTVSRAEYLEALTKGDPKALEHLLNGRLLDDKDRARVASMADEVQRAVTNRIRRHSVMEFHTFDWFEVGAKDSSHGTSPSPVAQNRNASVVALPALTCVDVHTQEPTVRERRGSMVSIRLK